MRAIALILSAVCVSGCLSTRHALRTHEFRVVTVPEGARIALRDEAGERILGASPIDAQSRYQVELHDFNEWWWLAPVVLGGMTAASWAWFGSSLSDASAGDDTASVIISGTLGGVAASAFLTSLLFNSLFQSLDGEETGGSTVVWSGDTTMIQPGTRSVIEITATKEGFQPSSHRLRLPSEHEEVHLLLRPAEPGGP